jgi:prepilin-type N-terminal cleavage/methylation domain-containing protein
MKTIKKNEKGFTLVELVIVVAILAILAALLVPRIMGNVEDAKKSRELANARTIASEITIHNALVKVEGTGTYIPNPLPTSGEFTLHDTVGAGDGYYDGRFGELPDAGFCTITVDSDGNATVVEAP